MTEEENHNALTNVQKQHERLLRKPDVSIEEYDLYHRTQSNCFQGILNSKINRALENGENVDPQEIIDSMQDASDLALKKFQEEKQRSSANSSSDHNREVSR